MLSTILAALAPVFFVMLVGYAAGSLRLVENHHVDGLNSLVMNFALPASLFVATASAPRHELLSQGPLFAILTGVMLIVQIAWYLIARRWWGAPQADASLQALTIAFPNLAGVGLPIASAIIGPGGTIAIAIALAAGSIINSPLSLLVVELSTGNGGRPIAAQVLQSLIRAGRKPVVVAPLLGILCSLAGFEIGTVAKACLGLLGEIAPGTALFLTGLVVSAQPFKLDWKVAAATAFGDVIRPLIALAIVLALPVSSEIMKVAVLIAAVPSGFFGILFAVNYRLNSGVIASMVAASSLVSMITLPITIALLFPS